MLSFKFQIFLRLDVLNQLEAKRDDIISDSIKNFQSFCRGYLSRKMAEKRRVHQLAIKCIQKNVRVFLSVKNWEWWRLYVKVNLNQRFSEYLLNSKQFFKVIPLLNGTDNSLVHLKNALEEQENLKKKLVKMEEERNLMNMENVRLKMKVSFAFIFTLHLYDNT
jgi:myosin heavy subunit